MHIFQRTINCKTIHMYSVYTWSWHPVPSLHGKEMEKQWKQYRLYFGGYKITADGNCSHEIKRHLLLRRKVVTNLDSILKSGDITLSTKAHLVKAMVFPVVMYGCESWTVKKAEHWRIDALCWRRLLRVSWPARRSKQSILKEIHPECSLEGTWLSAWTDWYTCTHTRVF